MSTLFKKGMIVDCPDTNSSYSIQKFLGDGTQGEVYQANADKEKVALKWYFPHYVREDPTLKVRLKHLINMGAPSNQFIWPLGLTSANEVKGFGYLMELGDPRYRKVGEWVDRKIQPSFYTLAKTGLNLVNAFSELHAKGLCYRDISFNNITFDPKTGDIKVFDNDNVDVDGREGAIAGTPKFMAPEIVRGEAAPSQQTDLHSLAVLLFYLFVLHHPLDGEKEAKIHSLDRPAMNMLYGDEPVFIFDPNDKSNRPVKGDYQKNANIFWPLYPVFFQDVFTKAFTSGLHDPMNGRARSVEWRQALVNLMDAIFYCKCGAENFYSLSRMKQTGGSPGRCWSCNEELHLPPRLKIDNVVIMLNFDTKLYLHHVEEHAYDFSRPLAEVVKHPKNPGIWGLKNLSSGIWNITKENGNQSVVEPGRSITIDNGTAINFGPKTGVMRA